VSTLTITAANIPVLTLSTPVTGPVNQLAQFTVNYSDLPPLGDTVSLSLRASLDGSGVLGAAFPLTGTSGSVNLSHLYSFVGNYDVAFRITAQFLVGGVPDGFPLTAGIDRIYHATAAVAPTPIPAALPLFAAALGVLGIAARRRISGTSSSAHA